MLSCSKLKVFITYDISCCKDDGLNYSFSVIIIYVAKEHHIILRYFYCISPFAPKTICFENKSYHQIILYRQEFTVKNLISLPEQETTKCLAYAKIIFQQLRNFYENCLGFQELSYCLRSEKLRGVDSYLMNLYWQLNLCSFYNLFIQHH